MPLSRLSIKHLLLLIVAIIALPAVCIIISSGLQQRKDTIHDAKMKTQELAETIVSEQKNLVASTRQLCIALSQLPEIKSHNPLKLQAVLAEILKQSPHFSNIFIADPSGRVWASAVPLQEAVSVADRRYFKNALASGKLSSGEYHIARISRKPTFNLGYPVKNNAGEPIAVIGVGFSLDHYRHILDEYKLPDGASFAIIDHQGVILARAIDPEKYVGKPSDPEIFKHMLEGPEEEFSIGKSSVTGENRVQTYRKLRLDGESTPYMYIRVGIPASIVMTEANAELYRNLMIYSAALLLALFLSWYVGKKHIIDRLVLLQRTAQRLADGDFNTQVAREVGGGELGKLGQSFDDMAQKLLFRETALRESESNYRGIFNTAHDALIVNDASGRIIEANKSSETMFGYTREELLQMTVEDLIAGAPPYSFPAALQLMEKSLQEGTQEFEWLSKRKNGESFWTEIAITPTDMVGERKILAVVSDITVRKEVQQMKEAMLSNISHEMRTPLTAMLGFLEFVTNNQVGEADLREYLRIMHKEGERLNEMITNFLDMQRLKAKLHEYDFKPLEPRPLLEEAAAIFASPSARHQITVKAPVALPPLLGDNELLHQAFANLLSNAIKYSPDGSEVVLDARLDGNNVTVWVKDEGIGIPAASIERIFDMFYRVDGTAKGQITGTGLGLALVKEIVAAHHGRIWVESTLGRGSIFYVSLPVAWFAQDQANAS